MTRIKNLTLALLLILLAAGLVLKFAIPSFANLFAGLGIEIPLPAAWVTRHPGLVMAYLAALVMIPVVLFVTIVLLLVRVYRKNHPKARNS